ncbi:MAG: type III-A CRISPR-associated protein Cas10/Csm1, partial [Thermosynechococcaceae cyanobacterium]
GHWDDLSLLALVLEKYGSCLSLGDVETAFCDRVRMTAAVAAALAQSESLEANLSLVAADLSGIQDFIYTISSDGALKSLRARSFYLELVTEEIVQQLLSTLQLPRTSLIYSGGGKLFLLAPATSHTNSALTQISQIFSDWLLRQFQGEISLSLDSHTFPIADLDVSRNQFSQHWEAVIRKLSYLKGRKFEAQLDKALKIKQSHEPCKVCHRDDEADVSPLFEDGPDSCLTCKAMWKLGDDLFDAEVIVRSHRPQFPGTVPLVQIEATTGQPVYYHRIVNDDAISQDPETVYLINNWQIENYTSHRYRNPTLLLLGNYALRESRSSFMTAEEFAHKSRGINRVGYLRMDVDRLGQIFARGLGDHTLPKLAGLSRQMSYFFKVYLNSLAADRKHNFLDYEESRQFKALTKDPRQDLLFIYAGGDDLFISGAWDQVIEFSQDVYQAFRAYTGANPDITLSAGISINPIKYPLYQAAKESGDAEGAAKGQGRNRLSLFGETFEWGEWLGNPELNHSHSEGRNYLKSESKPELVGIVPLVERLDSQLDQAYSRNFVQNLLATAQTQQRQIKEAQEKAPDQVLEIRYFLHLPKVAYTLARLPTQDKKISTALKSPWNAPYFRAIATWLSLLNREEYNEST